MVIWGTGRARAPAQQALYVVAGMHERKGVMTMDYQRIIVLGNVTRDAEAKQGEKGEFVFLTLASKVRSGATVYFSAFLPGKLAEFAKEVKKGALVLVDGALDVTEYKPEGGEKRIDLKIYVDSFRRLGPKKAAA